jgi:hypothetical protein
MPLGQWGVSVLVAGILAGNVWAVARGTDDWPFSSVPMFRQRFPPLALPARVQLVGVLGGVSAVLEPAKFGLDRNQLDAMILVGPGADERCGRLGDLFNRRRLPGARLTSLHVRVEFVPRPGVARREEPVVIHCRLTPNEVRPR